MKARSSQQAVSLSTAVSVLVVLAFLIGTIFLLVHQANFLIGRSLLIAFGADADSTYKGAWFQLDGDLVAKDFVLQPYGPDVDVTLRFKRIEVETPGWLWLLKTVRSSKVVADVDRLHLTLIDGSADDGVDPSLGDLGPFGTNTASPFEAEGCLKDAAWLRSELVDMGLAPGPTRLEFEYVVEQTKLTTRIALATPGVSKVTFTRHEILPEEVNPYLIDLAQTRTTDEHWQVQDDGFIKARNAYCAKRDGIDAGQFVLRHVETVQRLLATEGLALDAASLDLYSDFARNGGPLDFGGNYFTPLPSEIYYQARETGAALTRMHGIFERQGRKVGAQWSNIAARPLAGLDTSPSIYAAMVKEQGGVVASGTPVAGQAVASAAPSLAAAAASSGAPVPATTGAATRVAAGVAPAAATTAVASAVAPVKPIAPTTAQPGDELRWQDLSKYLGRDLEVSTSHMPARVVTLLEAGAQEIRVSGSVQGGRVENRINRDGFLRAVLLR
jgi:hypothetical protein